MLLVRDTYILFVALFTIGSYLFLDSTTWKMPSSTVGKKTPGGLSHAIISRSSIILIPNVGGGVHLQDIVTHANKLML
jgi:hypothetical protein